MRPASKVRRRSKYVVLAAVIIAVGVGVGRWVRSISAAQSSTKIAYAAERAETANTENAPEDPHARQLRMRDQMAYIAETEGWAQTYAGFQVAELSAERERIEQSIYENTKAVFEERFRAGRYELLGPGPNYSSPHFNPFDVYWVKYEPGVGLMKSTLPEADHPDIFSAKAKSVWLSDRIYYGAGDPGPGGEH